MNHYEAEELNPNDRRILSEIRRSKQTVLVYTVDASGSVVMTTQVASCKDLGLVAAKLQQAAVIDGKKSDPPRRAGETF